MNHEFSFIGGDVSVDLVNTVFQRNRPATTEDLLDSAEAAREWFLRAGILDEQSAAGLDAGAAQLSARRLRTALDAVYRPIARRRADEAGQARGLRTLNAVLDQGRERVQVALQDGHFTRQMQFEVIGPPDPSVRVAYHAAELLQRLEPHRLKECENPGCGLIFYDESRNASRRWCSMGGCGNQQKQARFRRARTAQRHQDQSAPHQAQHHTDQRAAEHHGESPRSASAT